MAELCSDAPRSDVCGSSEPDLPVVQEARSGPGSSWSQRQNLGLVSQGSSPTLATSVHHYCPGERTFCLPTQLPMEICTNVQAELELQHNFSQYNFCTRAETRRENLNACALFQAGQTLKILEKHVYFFKISYNPC